MISISCRIITLGLLILSFSACGDHYEKNPSPPASTDQSETSFPPGTQADLLRSKNDCKLITRNTISYAGQDIFNRVHLAPLHKQGYCGNGTIAALIDDGINFNDPLLQDKYVLGGGKTFERRLKTGISEIYQPQPSGITLLANPPEDFESSVSATEDFIYSRSKNGHGQWMAHILAGSTNSSGNIGVAPFAKLIPYPQNEGYFHTIEDAKRNGAKIVSISHEELTLAYFTNDYNHPNEKDGKGIQDVLIIAVAGNANPTLATKMESGSTAPFQTPYQNIAVTVAVDSQNKLTSSSRKCGMTQLFCIAIPSGEPTSPTAPVLAGTFAILLEAFPQAKANEIMRAVLSTATPLTNPDETGVGLLNAEAAFQSLEKLYPVPREGK